MSLGPSRTAVLHAYRALYRQGLKAVQYSAPARYAIRDKLRKSFRQRSQTDFNQKRIDNTLEFLRTAAERVGIEHRIVRNLCHVHFWQQNPKTRRQVTAALRQNAPATFQAYEETIRLLNESADLDLV
ncbi:hypothetical protein BDZ91DRAFT_789206 [Kalaharituber pfeilii]|nr:hypothetical protein BDZ91DRAFT_789206 [Kalaharituber pfeilii]